MNPVPVLVLLGLMSGNNLFLGDKWKNADLQQVSSRFEFALGNGTTNTLCSLCEKLAGTFLVAVKLNVPIQFIKNELGRLCPETLISKKICEGFIDVYVPTVMSALKQSQSTAKDICSLLLGERCPYEHGLLHEWNVSFPNVGKPDTAESTPQVGTPTLKVLQLTDLHLDLNYVEGTNGNCREPICCRRSSTVDQLVVFPAGRWGHYRCDPPKNMIEDMLGSIAKRHPDLDYIILTGDLVPHDDWNETRESALEHIDVTIAKLKEFFPNTRVFPALGNHESVPDGSYLPPQINELDLTSTWLYEKVAELWHDWIPNTEDATILLGGYYSHLVRPGLRVVSLNTNFCYKFNWWLYADSTDPAGQLQWLVQLLQKAENIGEKVHIIGHMAPGDDDCLKVWSRNYYDIVNRYESTIKAQFFGHTHSDEFKLFYDDVNPDRPINIAYVTPSVSPWDLMNPAYRIYHIDGDHDTTTREVVDHETWIFDLDEANEQFQDTPQWFRLYSAKDAYNLSSLKPSEWNKLIESMRTDTSLFDVFYRHYHRDSPVIDKYNPEEKLAVLCNLKSGRSRDKAKTCSGLKH